MADPRFYAVAGPFTLKQLADVSQAEMAEDTDPDAAFTGVAPLEEAGPEHISFLDNRRYADKFSASKAGACIAHPDMAERAPRGMALILSRDPYRAYARVAWAFHPRPAPAPDIAPSAVIDASALLGDGSRVEPCAVIGARAEIGRGCHIGAHAVIGDGVVLGDDCVIGSSVSLAYAIIGARVIIHAGARIGQDGFGFALGAEDHFKVPQLGRVLIGDDVEVGANSSIDRGTGPDTVVGAGTKIDNLVQIGHNVRLGRNCVLVSQVGISGSTQAGNHVMMGGQAGLAGHLRIGDGARIAAQSGVIADIEPGATVCGFPAMPTRQYWRQVAVLKALAAKKRKR